MTLWRQSLACSPPPETRSTPSSLLTSGSVCLRTISLYSLFSRTKADGLVGTEAEAGTKTVTAATSFSEMQTTVEEILTALGEKCLNSNCSYTALLKSTVNNNLGENSRISGLVCIKSSVFQRVAGAVLRPLLPRYRLSSILWWRKLKLM